MPRKIIEPENKRTLPLLVYFNKKERDKFLDRAKNFGMYQSEFLRFLALDMPLPNVEKLSAIDDLLKINADLARLGNLFKLAIDEEFEIPEEFKNIAENIRKIQVTLKEIAENLK